LFRDCVETVHAYFSDPYHVARIADHLEEDVVHHGSILQGWNINNTQLVCAVDAGGQLNQATSALVTVPSVPSSITGQPSDRIRSNVTLISVVNSGVTIGRARPSAVGGPKFARRCF